MKLQSIYILLAFLVLQLIMFSGCGDDSNPVSGEGEIEVSLENVSNGNGVAAISQDTSFTWDGATTWTERPQFSRNGKTYNEWKVTMQGENSGEELEFSIVEAENSSTMPGPDNGTYQVGAGQTQNSVSIRTNSAAYFSDLSSGGTIKLTQSSNGDIFEIELEATDLEIGGIGAQDEHIDVKAALKASKN